MFVEAIHLAGIKTAPALADVIVKSGWGHGRFWDDACLEKYGPDELQDSVAQLETMPGVDHYLRSPLTKKAVRLLNQILDSKIPVKADGRLESSCLPVALIYWLRVTGLKVELAP